MRLMKPFTRDGSEENEKNMYKLEGLVYILVPKEMDGPPETVLPEFQYLDGIPESGLHRYLASLYHHVGTLGMWRAKAGSFCFYIV